MEPKEIVCLDWMPLYIGEIFGSAWFQAMKDFQKCWYFCLLGRAWENRNMPCHLRNIDNELRVLACVSDERQWKSHNEIVMQRFLVTSDGAHIYNSRQLEIYNDQVEKYLRRKTAGQKGGLAKSSNARAMLQQCSSDAIASLYISSSDSGFDSKKPKPLTKVEAFTPNETAIAFCLERGWQGLEIRHLLSGAIDWLAAKRNSSDYPSLAKELIDAYETHQRKKGEFAGVPSSFFREAKYQEYVTEKPKPKAVNPADIVKRQAAGQYE